MAVRSPQRIPRRRAPARKRPERSAASGGASARKRIWLFEEGNAKMRDLLGGKGAGWQR